MLLYGTDMDTFLSQFKEMLLSIVVKQSAKAAVYETPEIKAEADKYVEMYYGINEWSAFSRFHRDVLVAAGVADSLINDYIYDKERIPYEIRETVMSLERQYIVDNYVEKNDYYRLLAGMPSMAEEEAGDFIFVPENTIGVSNTIPVHLLSEYQTDKFVNSPYYAKIMEENPEKEWLKNIGFKSIPPHKARKAMNYDILRVEKMSNAGNAEFFKNYANARNYVMKGIYNNEDRKNFQDYDSFMGFLILTMAVNRTFASFYKQGMTRTFYDDNLIRDLFACYNIPYQDTIEVKYQRILAKRLNILLSKKASNNVLYDIADLFEYSGVDIYSYYLMKDYKKDNKGDPIINYKTIVDEEGNATQIIDPETTYDIYFQRVNIRSEDPAAELADPSNRVEYDTLTTPDPYWVNDSDLLNKLYNSKFNHIITKYMSLDIAFDLSKMTYETTHAARLMMDAVPATKNIKIELPWVDDPVSLYDCMIFLNALMCKKCDLTGEIPLDPEQILTVYGFNFRADIEAIRDEILENIEAQRGIYSTVNAELIGYLKSISLLSPVYYARNSFTSSDIKKTVEETMCSKYEDLRALIEDAIDRVCNTVLSTTQSSEEPKEYNDNLLETIKDDTTLDTVVDQISAPYDKDTIKTIVQEVIDEYINTIETNIAAVDNGELNKVPVNDIAYSSVNTAVSLEDIRTMYEDIEALRKFVDEEMRYTNDAKAYEAYEKIYNTILVTNDIGTMYTKEDGSVAKTYDDLLQSRRPDLYEVLQDTEAGYPEEIDEDEKEEIPEIVGADDINNKINKILSSMSDVSEELKEMEYVNEKSQIVTNIEKVINQFKSYTVDLTESGVKYIISDPHMCLLKIIDSVSRIDQDYELDSSETKLLIDDVVGLIKLLQIRHRLGLKYNEEVMFQYRLLLKDFIRLIDKLRSMYVTMTNKSIIDLYDTVGFMIDKFKLEDTANVTDDDWSLKVSHDIRDYIHIDDTDGITVTDSSTSYKDIVSVIDTISDGRVAFAYYHALKLYEKLQYEYRLFINHRINLDHVLDMWEELPNLRYEFTIDDAVTAYEVIQIMKSDLGICDRLDIIKRTIPADDRMALYDKFSVVSSTFEEPLMLRFALYGTLSILGNNTLYSNVSFKDSITIKRDE